MGTQQEIDTGRLDGLVEQAPSPDGLGHSATIPSADEQTLGTISWCHEQAESIMAISAGAATTHGDPSGGLQMINSMASDIAINLEMLAQAIETRRAETLGSVADESAVPQECAPQVSAS